MTRLHVRVLSGAVLALGFTPLAALAQQKIAYVDLQKALTLTDEGKAAKDRLKRDFEAKQKKLDQAQEELKKKKDAFDKQSQLWTEDKRREEQTDLQRKLEEATKMWQDMQRELSEAEQRETNQIFQKMEVIVHDIAESEGITAVFNQSSQGLPILVYAPESMDLTPELVRKYNDRYPVKRSGGSAGGGKSSSQSK